MTEKLPTEKDYRAWLAFLWTGLTLVIFVIALWKEYTPEQIASILGPVMTLDGIFISGYFSKKNNG